MPPKGFILSDIPDTPGVSRELARLFTSINWNTELGCLAVCNMTSHTRLKLLLPGYTQLTYAIALQYAVLIIDILTKENGSLTRRSLSLRYPKKKGTCRPINKIKKRHSQRFLTCRCHQY